MQRFLKTLACVWSVALSPASFAGEPIVTTDLLRVHTVASIDVARDGSKAVFAVRSIAPVPQATSADSSTNRNSGSGMPSAPDTEPKYAYQSHLFLVDLNAPGTIPQQITFGQRNDSSPRIAPDGRRIVFVRETEQPPQPFHSKSDEKPDHDRSRQLWLLPLDGGEARQITDFEHGCADPVWSPDGRRILVTAALDMDEMEGVPTWPTERPKRAWKDASLPSGVTPKPDGNRDQIRAWLEHNASRSNPTVIDSIEFQEEHSLRGPLQFQHLFLLDPDSPSLTAAPILQTGARRITSGFFNHTEAAFMPDGQSVVYVSKKPTEQHLDRVLATSLWQVNTDGTKDHALLQLDGWTLSSPKPSRDGSVIAFLGQRMDEPPFRQTQLGIASIKPEGASDPVWLTDEATFPASVNSFEWSQLSPALVFDAAVRGGFPLMTVSPGLIQPATLVGEVDGRPTGVQEFGVGGGAIVYSQTTVAAPCVLRVRDLRGERTLMDLNPWVADKTLSMPTESVLTRPDGTKIQYWMMEPTNREPGRKYPLVIDMHGGPAAMWGPGEFTTWHELQLFCSWGFGVVYANPRGSGGYGYEFQKKNFQDWGEGPAGDVLAAVDEAVLKDWVDRDKLVITGGSYAGYLTVWIIAHDHRFKAAVAQRGVYDFNTFFGEGNAWRLIGFAMGGVPYDPRFQQVMNRNNVWNHVQRIRTPLLIKHASNDLRTGVSQSEMLYRALKDQNKPVEYVRYPDAGHDLSRNGDPTQRLDRLNRIIEFFERYVDNPRSAPVMSPN